MIENIFTGELDKSPQEHDIVSDANSLYDAFLAARSNSKWKGSVQNFELNFLRRISQLQKRLEDLTYEPDEGAEFVLSERGRKRPIHSKTIDDRVVSHSFCDNVLSPIVYNKIITNNCASIKGRGITKQRDILVHQLCRWYRNHGSNEGFIMLGDFSKYYDNLHHEIIVEMFRPYLSEYHLWLLRVFLRSFEVDVSYMTDDEFDDCMNQVFNRLEYWSTINKSLHTGEKFMQKSVDIGDQVSQCIGVFYPTRIDNYVTIVCGYRDYGRYMDDFYCMAETREELEDLLKGIEQEARQFGIFLNMKKTRIIKLSEPFRFLQIQYCLTKGGRIMQKINPKRMHAMRRKMKTLSMMIYRGERPREDIVNMIRSWLIGYKKYMSYEQRENMAELFANLFPPD